MNQYIKQYQKSQIETASQEQILIMLYNGAIQFLNIARKAMEDKDIEGTHNNILKAQKIITEFQTTLDMENGGELAQRLYSLYAYLHKKLVSANINKSFEDLDEVLEHLKDLRNTWLEAIKIANQEKAQNGEVENSEEKTHSWSVGEE
ncbi:flagellar export chaperone FliS [bacterium]|nr:flagellar export chaperone FliS [bacterium]